MRIGRRQRPPRLVLYFAFGSFVYAANNLFLSFLLPAPVQSVRHPSTINTLTSSSSHQGSAAADDDADNDMSSSSSRRMIVATRFHLGKATVPPSQDDLDAKILSFARFCSECHAEAGVIAVDAEERIPGYNLVRAIELACNNNSKDMSPGVEQKPLHVLPVQPWGKFVPALNALISWAANKHGAHQILFASAETTASLAAIERLQSKLCSDDDDTLVVGAVLPGHDYKGNSEEEEEVLTDLNGRTSPWNTLALWNVQKLALTGFQGVSEEPSVAGVEEVAAIAVLQRLLGENHAKAKLVKVPNVNWDQKFEDPSRQQWHEQKMQSKLTRAAQQLERIGLQGTVYHC